MDVKESVAEVSLGAARLSISKGLFGRGSDLLEIVWQRLRIIGTGLKFCLAAYLIYGHSRTILKPIITQNLNA
ncbi:MAG: hypothetical protein DMF71_12270 [Acidobacteria bacterium]|nr:MAG: hypothetical protein DMF71_12270 [Acidobacteriota bacterium]